jgi:CO dehydrogenase nickel-insertion accessory protein CooC1
MKISFYDPEEEKPTRKRDSNSSFTLDWVSELGWKENPFTLSNRIAGFAHEEHEVNLFFIKQRRFGTITGPTGIGKTTLLTWLTSELEGRRGFRVVVLDADLLTNEQQLLNEIADNFRGMFAKGKDISSSQLHNLLIKKTKQDQLVLLIDNAETLENEHMNLLEELLGLSNTQILLAAHSKQKDLPADDELELVLKQRDEKHYEQILIDRIEAVGGKGIHPFTISVIQRMTKETENTEEFLKLAHETAIHIALNKVTGEEESPEEVIEESKKSSSRKKTSSGVQGRKRTKYDELIESLGEELTK